MKSFLITFKPITESPRRGWPLESLQRMVKHYRAGKRVREPWRFLNRKDVSPGDRVFLLIQGKLGPAIIGYGNVAWGSSRPKQGSQMIEFGALADPETETFANREDLYAFDRKLWHTQVSGVRMPDPISTKIERLVVGKQPKLNDPVLRVIAHSGAGFGDPKTNKRVERSAVTAVTRKYRSHGWNVESCEKECLGYDLRCKKGSSNMHIEVKGVQGSIPNFILTRNEKRVAQNDKAFRLVIVTYALEPTKQRLETFTGRQLLREFTFEPMSFVAKQKRHRG